MRWKENQYWRQDFFHFLKENIFILFENGFFQTATQSHLSGVLANVTLCNGNGTSNGHPQMPNQSQIHCAMPPSDNDLARLIDHGEKTLK